MGLGISRTNADSQWIQFLRRFIEFVLVETNHLSVVISTWFGHCKHAARARAGLRVANAECSHFVVLATSQCCRLSGEWHAFDPIQETQNSSTQITEQQHNNVTAHRTYLFVVGQRISMLLYLYVAFTRVHSQMRNHNSTGWFREIETTVFDPASVFLSTHWWSQQPSLPVLFL